MEYLSVPELVEGKKKESSNPFTLIQPAAEDKSEGVEIFSLAHFDKLRDQL